MTRDVAGLVVALTGGARGIGAASAAALARAGARVAIGDLDAAAAERTADGFGGVGLGLDVTDPASYRAFADAVTTRLGAVDVFVANAGVMWVGRFDEEPESAIARQLAVNVTGVITGVRTFAPAMLDRGRGQLLVVASAGSRLPPAGEATYSATKHAVLGYCTAVRAELRGSGVDVSVLMPAVVSTALAAGTHSGMIKPLSTDQVSAAVVSLVRRPRPERYVPPLAGVAATLLGLTGGRARVALHRLLVPDEVTSDQTARAAYQRDALGPS